MLQRFFGQRRTGGARTLLTRPCPGLNLLWLRGNPLGLLISSLACRCDINSLLPVKAGSRFLLTLRTPGFRIADGEDERCFPWVEPA